MNPSDPTPGLDQFESYADACADFRWSIPDRFNIASEICRRQADSITRIALLDVKFASVNAYTFGGLDYLSDKFAVVLSENGIGQADRVAIALPQSADAAIAVLGTLKAGAVAVITGPSHNSIADILLTSRARAGVIDQHSYDRVEWRLDPGNRPVFVSGRQPASGGFAALGHEITAAPSDFEAADVDAGSPAMIFPNHAVHHISAAGIVHSHGSILGQLPAFEMATESAPGDHSVFWTPMNWSSPSVLLGILFPAWWYGCAVVSLDRALPAGWINALQDCSVTHAFVSPMHLRFLLDAEPAAGREHFGHLRRIICSASVEPELRSACGRAELSTLCGWPETPAVIASCARWFSTPEGWSGKAAPGFSIEVLDAKGRVSTPGTLGRIAIDVPPQLAPSILRPDGEIEKISQGLVDVGSSGIKADEGHIWVSDAS